MSYFKKSHQHKPKKGKGSYNRILEKLKEPFPDEPSVLCGEIVEKDNSPWQEKYKGKSRNVDRNRYVIEGDREITQKAVVKSLDSFLPDTVHYKIGDVVALTRCNGSPEPLIAATDDDASWGVVGKNYVLIGDKDAL